MHNEHNICHRDLKPENFLFKTDNDEVRDARITCLNSRRGIESLHFELHLANSLYLLCHNIGAGWQDAPGAKVKRVETIVLQSEH